MVNLFLKPKLLILGVALALTHFSNAQNDSTTFDKPFTMGVLPAIAYDSDLGFQYGALTNLFWYNNDAKYPQYSHSLYLEASKYTAGSSLLRAFYDSPKLIHNVRTTFDITWVKDLTMDFYGFNGYEAQYHSDWEDPESSNYFSRMFYHQRRDLFRVMGNFRVPVSSSHWQIVGGFTFISIYTAPVDVEKLNSRSKNDPLPDVDGLFAEYLKWNIIPQDEKSGGWNAQLKGGISYDSRNMESSPSKGCWSELLLSGTPTFLSQQHNSNLILTAVHRQYIALSERNTVLAARIQFQQVLAGEQPSYLLSNIPATWLVGAFTEGLGGAKTLRGIRRNRVVGKGFAMTNIELRQRISEFKIKKNQYFIAANAFFDAGMITQRYKIDLSEVPEDKRSEYFGEHKDSPHCSGGLGLKIGMNENFIVSIEYGKAFNQQDGNSGFYINMNYLF